MAPKWEPDPAGRIKVEPKDETKERLGRSPDDADALLLAFHGGGGALTDYMSDLMAAQSAAEQAGEADVPLLDAGTHVPMMPGISGRRPSGLWGR